jgi:hypothetical protein
MHPLSQNAHAINAGCHFPEFFLSKLLERERVNRPKVLNQRKKQQKKWFF